VRHQDRGCAQRAVEPADQIRDHAGRDRIKTGERLVVHYEHRIERNRTSQRNAACHSTRQLRGRELRCAAQADRVELHEHEVANHRFRQTGVLVEREGHVIENRQVGEQSAELEQHPHTPPQPVQVGVRELVDALAGYGHTAPSGLQLTADQPQDRGLARSRQPHDCDDPAARDHHSDPGQHGARVVAKFDVAKRDQIVGAHLAAGGLVCTRTRAK
jgi:hypothetical protein